ncbi:hypothetical protein JKF63_07170 [Porcisia hertigi]|uniref:Uncharacterized protein n=1 Tax=Porcisia hertigi TaxID=2761500 RepID=A0A836LKG6_9TRYP|nr:hypothetical protein JKF63_07170 [Porcisia hertigi]
MLRYSPARRCSTAAMQTLSAWLTCLAKEAGAVPATGSADAHARSNEAHESTHKTPEEVWRELEGAATHANALRETDALLSIMQCLLLKRQYPSDVRAWTRLAKQLLPYSGIEQKTVLHYPGRSDASCQRDGYTGGRCLASLSSPSSLDLANAEGGHPDEGGSRQIPCGPKQGGAHAPLYSLYPSREMLLLSGGSVPLSARVPLGDGRVVALFLRGFTRYVRDHLDAQLNPELLEVVRDVSSALMDALNLNAHTIELELLLPTLLDYMELLHLIDLRTATETGAGSLTGEDEHRHAAGVAGKGDGLHGDNGAPSPMSSRATRFLQNMADSLSQSVMTSGARGARVVLYYLNGHFASVVEEYRTRALATFTDKMYWAQQRYLLNLTRGCMWAISLRYLPIATEESSAASRSTASSSQPYVTGLPPGVTTTDLVATAPMNPHIQALYDHIDVLFQQNTHADNPLSLTDEEVAQLKEIHTAALLRALRIEEASPDAYLRRALEVMDRVPASMAIEGELIAGKVRLLELDSDTLDEEGRTAIYADLLTSLRSLVEMRPRFTRRNNGSLSVADAASDSAPSEGGGDDDDEGYGEQLRVDAATQAILQRAHVEVITAFCAAHEEEWSNEAYSILVAHKYHGIKITNDLIRPVLEVFSRRGDCRVFSLIDLCVLYSHAPIDMHTIALLFRTCAAAGDHFRARTFLQLLGDIIPGFLVKCPASVKESLRELRVLDHPPRHLFVSTEDDLVQSTLGEEQRTVRPLPTGP